MQKQRIKRKRKDKNQDLISTFLFTSLNVKNLMSKKFGEFEDSKNATTYTE